MVDDSIRSRLRQYISAVLMCCQYPLFRPCGTYRLRRQSANTCHRHRQIALCSTTSDSECSALSSTASFHNKSSTTLLTLIRALVVSKVDYCCSVLAGVSGHLLDRLQSILNAAARLMFSARHSKCITPLLRDLHWLQVPEQIQFRLCVLGY